MRWERTSCSHTEMAGRKDEYDEFGRPRMSTFDRAGALVSVPGDPVCY